MNNELIYRIAHDCPYLINVNINNDKEVFEICPLLEKNTHIQAIVAKGEQLSENAINLLLKTIKNKKIRLSIVKDFTTIEDKVCRFHFPS